MARETKAERLVREQAEFQRATALRELEQWHQLEDWPKKIAEGGGIDMEGFGPWQKVIGWGDCMRERWSKELVPVWVLSESGLGKPRRILANLMQTHIYATRWSGNIACVTTSELRLSWTHDTTETGRGQGHELRDYSPRAVGLHNLGMLTRELLCQRARQILLPQLTRANKHVSQLIDQLNNYE